MKKLTAFVLCSMISISTILPAYAQEVSTSSDTQVESMVAPAANTSTAVKVVGSKQIQIDDMRVSSEVTLLVGEEKKEVVLKGGIYNYYFWGTVTSSAGTEVIAGQEIVETTRTHFVVRKDGGTFTNYKDWGWGTPVGFHTISSSIPMCNFYASDLPGVRGEFYFLAFHEVKFKGDDNWYGFTQKIGFHNQGFTSKWSTSGIDHNTPY